MDIDPYIALLALVVGTPYMAYKKQWIFSRLLLANALTYVSLVLLALGVYQLVKQSRSTQSAS